MSTLTKEWLLKTIAELEEEHDATPGAVNEDAANALAAMKLALVSLEAEAVGEVVLGEYDDCGCHPDAKVVCIAADGQADWENFKDGTRLYTAPPAPVSVPDERYQHLSELYHAQEKRLFKLAQRIKGASFDKYAYSPSQAIDVLESAIFGEREDECRAAILHGADRPQNEPQNIPENIPATQFDPVADLYGLTSPTGSETSFTFDAVEARDFIDGGWSCQEYVELGRFQEAMLQNGNSPAQSDCCPEQNYIAPAQDGDSPVIPDGWVACSDRMPEQFKAILAFNEYGEVWSGAYDRYWNFYCDNLLVEHVTHWMPLPNPPKE
ncbi:Protein of uncharacterised function (DUF551) [Enterobacter hormaechei]|uniref:DUF551 domain-containing protein n=1 Tax=Enterobacter hormaechei TaxID=158836 RepID=UPI000791C849|nr:DUF551 domain-containing protein [Enterobacter hormaechei]CZV46816.1 Protein of uncharacterised function (DUF551) [Enterobacter hormaechei]SAC89840.1 Protein of uncharacterised function (DUF551) [Enterobacter hormaechei]